MERLGESVAALAAGEIGFAHLALIARTSAALGQRLNEAKLLGQARKLNIFPFRNRCTHARHAGDPAGFVNEEKEGVEARSLSLTTADDGVVLVQGILDKVGGAALRTALEPLAKRAGKYDDRDRERRMADALVDLSMHALDNGVPSRRPHVQVTTSLETLLGLAGAPAAEMEFSLPSPPRNHGAGTPVGRRGWRATARSLASCSTPNPWSSMSDVRSEWYRARRPKRSRFATGAAPGQVVTGRPAGLRRTT
jgi:hypothetical protein